MKARMIMLLLFFSVAYSLMAQNGHNQVQLFVAGGKPHTSEQPGLGGGIKGLYGQGEHGQFTLTASLMKFHAKKAIDLREYTIRVVPVLAGYRQNLSKFYIEPQIGIGELGGKMDINGDYARPSVAAFCWGLGMGINYRRFDVGLRYLHARSIEGQDAGLWYDKKFGYTALHFGYNIFR